jgi:two-component system, NtrC family, response regulator GlrR
MLPSPISNCDLPASRIPTSSLTRLIRSNQQGCNLSSPLQRAFPHRPVLVTTMHPDAFDVFPLLEMGAADFLLPPLRSSEVVPRLKRQARISIRGSALVEKLKEDIGLKQIIGESPQFLEQVPCVPRFARCNATVLISGESGIGKELFARAIHYLSLRAEHSDWSLVLGFVLVR